MVEPDRLGDRYRIQKRVAVNETATTYLAEDERRGSPVTVKILNEDLAADPDIRKDLSKRARAVAALSHPNIAGVLDYGEDNGRQFVVVEQLEGDDLGRLVAEEGPLTVARVLSLAQQVCDALAHAHSAGIVHGGLTSTNVLVMSDDRVKVADFEIGPAGDDPARERISNRYRAPERVAGKRIGPETDIYSLGMILSEMVTGPVPEGGTSIDRIPAPFSEIVARATASNADDRYRNATAFRAALETAVAPDLSPAASNSPQATGLSSIESTRGQPPAGDGDPPSWPLPVDRYDAERLGKRVLAGFLVLAVVALGAFLWRLRTEIREGDLNGANGGRPTASESTGSLTIPDVVGMEDSTAVESLSGIGLEPVVRPVPSRGSPGIVLDQNPNAGTVRAGGSRVILFVGREVGGGDGPSDPEDSPGPSPSP